MKLSSAIAGEQAGPLEQALDSRWLMAYSAGLGETDARYFDTEASVGVSRGPSPAMKLILSGEALRSGKGLDTVRLGATARSAILWQARQPLRRPVSPSWRAGRWPA